MVNYCFVDGKRALFSETCMRGWLAAILDFPHFKNHEESTAVAQGIPDELRTDVCCIPGDDEYSYRHLVVTAWVISYDAFRRLSSEREKVIYSSVLKPLPKDEALAILCRALSDREVQAVIDEAYERYLATLSS